MNPLSFRCSLLLGLTLLSAHSAHALEIRSYSPARHDRFVGTRAAPTFNDQAYYHSRRYTGVGYAVLGERQFALVSPLHVVAATHFRPASGVQIRFVNAHGVVFTRTVLTSVGISNGQGGTSDVAIATLNAPLTAEQHQIDSLPILDYPTEAQYLGLELVTFGASLRAGRGVISSLIDFSSSSIDATRCLQFTYTRTLGNSDDAYAVAGDSGSPTFGLVNDQPALVGVHTAALSTLLSNTTIDAFVPHYAEAIDALIEPTGYRLRRINQARANLSQATSAQGILRQGRAGTVALVISNHSPELASNLSLSLEFAADQAPSSLSAAGWIVENPNWGRYVLRRASLAAQTHSRVELSWQAFPAIAQLEFESRLRHDSDQPSLLTHHVPLAPSFALYVAGLSADQRGLLDDADFDGMPNLLEYAFLLNPEAAEAAPMSLTFDPQDQAVHYTFPVRSDAAEAGLNYVVECSPSLTSDSWSSELPAGTTVTERSFDPPRAGLLERFVKVPGTAQQLFLRVLVRLDEDE